jgi:hypothetical protein
MPLQLSDALGHFKNEINGVIVDFHSFGVKNYSIHYIKDDSLLTQIKVKGLALKSVDLVTELTNDVYVQSLENAIHNQTQNLYLCQHRFKLKENHVTSNLHNFTFSNIVSRKRYLVQNYETLPYGYKFPN